MTQLRRSRPGTAGLLVLMATTGALLAFGWRDGEPAKAFRNAGRMLLETRVEPGTLLPIVLVAVGALHHIVVSLLWGILLVLLVRRFSGMALAGAAIVVSIVFGLLNLWFLPPVIGVGYSVVTSVGRVIPFALAIAVALLVTPWASGVPEQHPSHTSLQ